MSVSATTQAGEWKSWQIALAIGLPVVACGVGVYFIRKSKKSVSCSSAPSTIKENDSSKVAQKKSSKAWEKLGKEGNTFFKQKKYLEAIKKYAEAIAVCDKDDAKTLVVLYGNRATSFYYLEMFEETIKESTLALQYSPKYTKGYGKRYLAHEALGNLEAAFEDVTAMVLLQGCQEQDGIEAADRVLKALSKKKAAEAFKNRKLLDPSPYLVKNYFVTFVCDPVFSNLDSCCDGSHPPVCSNENMNGFMEHDVQEASEKQSLFQLACIAFREHRYTDCEDICTQQLLIPLHLNIFTLLLRGTLRTLRGDIDGSEKDFRELLNSTTAGSTDQLARTSALIKLGALQMQRMEYDTAIQTFEQAVLEDPENPDIYQNRAQVYLLMENPLAVDDFDKCCELRPDFPMSHFYRCYAEGRRCLAAHNAIGYKESCEQLEKFLKKFSKSPEGYALLGQMLMEVGEIERARENFEKALKLDPNNSNTRVHLAVLHMQATQSISKSRQLIDEAIRLDPKCLFAYEVLATMLFQCGDITEAQKTIASAMDLSRTEMEVMHLISMCEATTVQAHVAAKLGIKIPDAPLQSN